ncbi:MAG: hypothetical protein ACPGN6_06930 [Gammaproteobacteria bacterium]
MAQPEVTVGYLWTLLLCIGVFLAFDSFRSEPHLDEEHYHGMQDAGQLLLSRPLEISIILEAKQFTFVQEGDDWIYVTQEAYGNSLQDFFNAALTLLLVTKVERTFSVPKTELSDYGINKEALTLVATAENADLSIRQRFKFGNVTPDLFGQYVYDEQGAVIHIIPEYQGQNLRDLILRVSDITKY